MRRNAMGLDQLKQSVLAEVLRQNKAISSQSQYVTWRNSNDMARRVGGCQFVSGRMILFFFVSSFLFSFFFLFFFFSFNSVFLVIVVLFCPFR